MSTTPKTSTTAKKTTNKAQNTDGIRLNVFLQSRGVASRRRADDLIMLGRVKINDKVVKQHGTRVAATDVVSVDGEVISTEVPKITLLFYKPDMCITARSDPEGRKTIFDLPALRHLPKNVQAVGRLDFRSEGLMLLTNDGDLAYALTHPKYNVNKTYAVLLADAIRSEEVDKLKKGIRLDDGLAKATAVNMGGHAPLGSTQRGQWVEIVVNEGRNRLIRRMMDALGIKVVRLVRIATGSVQLPYDLKVGQVRPISPEHTRYFDKVKKEVEAKRNLPTDLSGTGLSKNDLAIRKAKRRKTLNAKDYQERKDAHTAESVRRERERRAATGKAKSTQPSAVIKPKERATSKKPTPRRTKRTPRPASSRRS